MRVSKKLFLLLCVTISGYAYGHGGIFYSLSGGRFGDNILAYARAALLAHKHNAPLYYTPFAYSDQLTLSSLLPRISHYSIYRRAIKIENGYLNNFNPTKWYNISYCERTDGLYEAMVTDAQFAKKVLSHISPQGHLVPLSLPRDKITVAVHVRKGGGLHDDYRKVSPIQLYTKEDIEEAKIGILRAGIIYSDKIWPMKFPPDQYYIDQIKRLSTILNDQRLQVHIFTDDPDPQKLVELYKDQVNKSNISFSCREEGNNYDANVLEDFFAMAYQFDCLIRSGSNFGWAAQFVGQHKIIIAQEHERWIGNILLVDKVAVTIRHQNAYTTYFFPEVDEYYVRDHIPAMLFDKEKEEVSGE